MKKSVNDLGEIKGLRALMRVDINVPLDENKNVTDDTRIQAILPTVKFLKEGNFIHIYSFSTTLFFSFSETIAFFIKFAKQIKRLRTL